LKIAIAMLLTFLFVQFEHEKKYDLNILIPIGPNIFKYQELFM